MPQEEIVEILAEWGRRWSDPGDPWRRQAEGSVDPFPFAMTRVSLEGLLRSVTRDALWALIDAEGVRGLAGPRRVGHVIAGNTPLLAWSSLLRAMLMGSQSQVKLPSGPAAGWGHLFQDSLAAVSPELASGIVLETWPGGTPERERAFCREIDRLLVYGSDATIAAWRDLCPANVPLIGYGHRVSFGLVASGEDWEQAVAGLARDVLLFDQGGCLSPQTVYVLDRGDEAAAEDFGALLAEALHRGVAEYPLPLRLPGAAARVREARAIARMEPGTQIWGDPGLRWTVLGRAEAPFALSPGHGVVSVQPLVSLEALPGTLTPVRGHLQGCALALGAATPAAKRMLTDLGVTYLCAPGELQAPPLGWHQDGIPPLRSLL